MQIREMFAKPIGRDIKGVIKVGQGDDGNVKQELEEYVVTRELEKHFADFFESYSKGIHGRTDKMGVWISGFFGSGKSHFLKILSYILENRTVDGRTALDYFVDDHKISDSMTLANMRLAASTSTDVILFNIDSKSEVGGKQNKDAIVSVFLKVFNEKLGFCGSNPFLADLERRLSDEGRYDEFMRIFEENFGTAWTEARNDFDFIQDDVVETLSAMEFMSAEAARNWCEKATETYTISIETFANMVKKHIDRCGDNHHFVFLVDEIGQYIGDDSKLMLNLQTVTEDLGTACGGKVWIIVTSQEAIDSIIKPKGDDFSKIQGRFDTRLSLSSANVDEVIRKRILEKTPTAAQTLGLLYDESSVIIKNLIIFNDGVEKKLYSDRSNFSAVYPFVPYQFNLLASVLTSIRTHGASGKHLSEGERSMLALFKESAMRLVDENPGALVPFNLFYDALERFLDHGHRSVITRALDNEQINPDHLTECFDVNVLKTLFLIKYVNEVASNAENIASLMVPTIDTDRIELVKRVEEALKRLVRQMYVQKNGELYVFLTDEEQEINREIEAQNVETSEVIGKVAEMIFDGLYDEKKYRYPAFNGRYSFGFNQFVDDRPYKANQNYDIGLKILTPNYDKLDDTTLRMLSGQSSSVIVVLPDNSGFLEEIRAALKIDKYLRLNITNTLAKHEQIREAKKRESRERSQNALIFLEDALKDAVIYVNGDNVRSGSKEVKGRITEALGKLVSSVYYKLHYIDAAMSEANITQTLRTNDTQQQIKLGAETPVNQLALSDMLDFIGGNSARHTKTSMKTIIERFTRAPYGFIETDAEWLVAYLFRKGDVALYINNDPVTPHNRSTDELLRYLTKKEFVEKLLTDRKEKANERQKKAVREVMKELFNVTPISDDDDSLMGSFQQYCTNTKNDLEKLEIMYKNQPAYPGKSVVSKGKALLLTVIGMKFSTEFYVGLDGKREDYLEFAEDYAPVKAFFAGEQIGIFDNTVKLMGIYDDSKTFIVDAGIESVVKDIKSIMKMSSPYSNIKCLPELLAKFSDLYNRLLDTMEQPVISSINEAHNRVMDELSDKQCLNELNDRFMRLFQEIKDKAQHCNNVATLQNIKIEADALKVRLLNEIADKEAEIEARNKPLVVNPLEEKDNGGGAAVTPVKPVIPRKKKKTISIKTINLEATWQLETEADVDRYVEELRSRLKKTLEEGTTINIEF